MQTLTILGATGSIGESTLDVVARHPDRYRIYALTAHSQVEKLAVQCLRFQPKAAVVGSAGAAERLQRLLVNRGCTTTVLHGPEALIEVAHAGPVDTVMAAIVGAAGMPPTIAAAQAGKRILLANKEALVVAGSLFMQAVRDSGAVLLPIDSEHNAIYQCLPDAAPQLGRGIRRLTLTASGGPFRSRPVDTLVDVTPEQACAHPNWVMGRKISVDSATMMNKGLEVIEAHWLFSAPAERIDVLIHPQSIIHSMVSYDDGSVLAQLGNPDMRTPIAYGLAWPERIEAGVEPLDLTRIAELTFEPPDLARFPCLQLAFDALREGGASAVVLNAANEMAVQAFLDGKIGFAEIASTVAETMQRYAPSAATSLEGILEIDREARAVALECCSLSPMAVRN